MLRESDTQPLVIARPKVVAIHYSPDEDRSHLNDDGLLRRASGRSARVKRRLLDALDDHDEIVQSSIVLSEKILGNASRRILALVGLQRVLL